jgi:3-oxoacyl-[acyl-carrier-protein] synthase II
MLREHAPQRVVVTGLGVATSLGVDVGVMWDRITAGHCGITTIQQYDSSAFPVSIGSEVDMRDLADADDDPALTANRSLRFAKWAAVDAWRDARLADAGLCRDRAGVCVGAGGFPAVETRLSRGIDRPNGTAQWSARKLHELLQGHPELMSQYQLGAMSSCLSRHFALRGISLTVQGACTSGTQAVGEAFRLIRGGAADVMLAGGADSMMSAFGLAGFTLLGALSTHRDPATASRPFDLTRNGFVIGEGAGMVILESEVSAARRGARIHAEVLGYGTSSDGYRFTDVHPEGWGAVKAMRACLADARLTPERVDYINAHGTSTPQNDRVETLAIKQTFGAHAGKLAISSTKSHLGHLICATGAVEFLLTCLTVRTAVVPATLNLHRRDPECDLDFVPLEARRLDVGVALSNSFGFGGQNGTIAVRKWAA